MLGSHYRADKPSISHQEGETEEMEKTILEVSLHCRFHVASHVAWSRRRLLEIGGNPGNRHVARCNMKSALMADARKSKSLILLDYEWYSCPGLNRGPSEPQSDALAN